MANETFKQQIRAANDKNRRDPLGLREDRERRQAKRETLLNEQERVAFFVDEQGIVGSLGPDENNNLRLTEAEPLTKEERQELLDRWNAEFGSRIPCASCGHPESRHTRTEVGFLETIKFCSDRGCRCDGFQVRRVEEVEEAFNANLSIDKRRNELVREVGKGYLSRQVPLEIAQKAVELIDAASKDKEIIRRAAMSEADRIFYAATSSIENLRLMIGEARNVIEQAKLAVEGTPIAMGRINRVDNLLDRWAQTSTETLFTMRAEIKKIRERQTKTANDT